VIGGLSRVVEVEVSPNSSSLKVAVEVLMVSVGLLNKSESNSDGEILDNLLEGLVGVVESFDDEEGSKRGEFEEEDEEGLSRLFAAESMSL